MAQKLPLGVQTFDKIITGGYVYVDKTALVHQLVKNNTYVFLSRPRRFGKSLLLSTLDAYFSGRKDLFQGLAMKQLETEWETHPVLRLDLNTGKFATSVDELTDLLASHLRQWESQYDLEPTQAPLGVWFGAVIKSIHDKTGKQVVILVDEYD